MHTPKEDFTAENAESAEKKQKQESKIRKWVYHSPLSSFFFSALSAFSAVKSFLRLCG